MTGTFISTLARGSASHENGVVEGGGDAGPGVGEEDVVVEDQLSRV